VLFQWVGEECWDVFPIGTCPKELKTLCAAKQMDKIIGKTYQFIYGTEDFAPGLVINYGE
jgi:hypothetical protein